MKTAAAATTVVTKQLAEREAQLQSVGQRLSLLEAEEGRIEELEELLKEQEKSREDREASLVAASTAAKLWEGKHREAAGLLRQKNDATATLVKEKNDFETKQFEADLKMTRLQGELLSSKKALRQAVNQLRQLEMEAEQERVAISLSFGRSTAASLATSASSSGRCSGSGDHPTRNINAAVVESPSATAIASSVNASTSRTNNIPVSELELERPSWHTPTRALKEGKPRAHPRANAPSTARERVSRIRGRMQDLLKQVGCIHRLEGRLVDRPVSVSQFALEGISLVLPTVCFRVPNFVRLSPVCGFLSICLAIHRPCIRLSSMRLLSLYRRWVRSIESWRQRRFASKTLRGMRSGMPRHTPP